MKTEGGTGRWAQALGLPGVIASLLIALSRHLLTIVHAPLLAHYVPAIG